MVYEFNFRGLKNLPLRAQDHKETIFHVLKNNVMKFIIYNVKYKLL